MKKILIIFLLAVCYNAHGQALNSQINNVTQVDATTLDVNTTYTFQDGSRQTIDVMVSITPSSSITDINTAIYNRGVSEEKAIEAKAVADKAASDKAKQLMESLNH